MSCTDSLMSTIATVRRSSLSPTIRSSVSPVSIAIGRSTDAEVAFVVADGWQGRGLGTVLFDRLTARARAVGIDRIVAITLAHNTRMLALFRRSGYPMTVRHDAEVVDVTLELTR